MSAPTSTKKEERGAGFNSATINYTDSNNVVTCDSSRDLDYRYNKGSDTPVDIGSTVACESASHPMVNISIMGCRGVAIVDTGATHCIASPMLYRVLVDSGVTFQDTQRQVRLADGSQSWRALLTTETLITIEGREVTCEFLVLPGADTRTLLGIQFLSQTGMVLDIAQSKWMFADDPGHVYDFVQTYTLNTADTDLMRADSAGLALRHDEGTKLRPEQRRALDKFICSRAQQFAHDGPPTDFATHRIKVSPDQEPIASPPYRLSQNRKEALQKELDKLLRDDVIEECESPWASNVVLVTKKDGSLRLCIDYRKLNAVTEPDRYPLPRIEDILHAAKTSEYMTTLDLRSGYHQVSVSAEDQDKTAFTTPLGTFRFKRMPMGLRNSGATFQRLMDRFRSNLKGVDLLAYLDDLVLLSPGPFERHMSDLAAVFDRLAMFKLRVNREKSHFARESVKFLGHVIVPGGIQVDPDKTAAIDNMAVPRNVKHLKCFLQTSSWFRRFISNYAEIARPLTELLKKVSTWRWEAEQQEAFERIKSLLVSAPILRQADESKPFVLRTDSSGYCLGAVLMQGEGPDERPIEYASRLLTSAERNYSTTEREALAVVWALGKFRGYVECAKIIVRTDHQPLRWLMSQRSPSGRLARWALTLQEYDLNIEYTPGRSNVIADTLSRPVCSQDPDCELCFTAIDMPRRSTGNIRENQLKDPEVSKIIEDLESDEPSRGRPWSDRGYTISDGILYRYSLESDDGEDSCLVVPEHERRQVMADLHDAPTAGHFGVERTLSRVRSRFYWPGMRAFVTEYIRECVPCQRYKADNRKPAGLLQTPAVSRRFEVVSVDLFGPLVETARKNRWVLIVEDVCSRWVELFPLESATSVECAQTLVNEVFLRYGVPRRLISDNGVQFVSEVMQQVCHILGISQTLTPYYHPEANPIERKNRDLKPQLAILVGQDHSTWDLHLAAVRFAMNSANTSSTGFSPAFLTFGRELRAPSDSATDMRAILDKDNFVPCITPYLKRISETLDEARDTHEKAQGVQKKNADKKRRTPPEYQVGDLVLLKTQGPNDAGRGQSTKFIPRRDGPYKIGTIVSPTTYVLENVQTGGSVGKYHVSHLTPFSGQVEPPVREKRKRGRPRRYLDC